jgi:hypothetical protein
MQHKYTQDAALKEFILLAQVIDKGKAMELTNKQMES